MASTGARLFDTIKYFALGPDAREVLQDFQVFDSQTPKPRQRRKPQQEGSFSSRLASPGQGRIQTHHHKEKGGA